MLGSYEYANKKMSGLENLKARLEYQGGINAEGRMQEGKLRSLKKALLYSYQAETAIINGKMFRCLLNSDKLKADYDCKILSIPYEDICLGEYNEDEDKVARQLPDDKTSNSIIPTGVKSGDVFLWKETNTHWIIYLQHLEENAYFRGEVYKCEEEPVIINGKKYYVYIRGPIETTLQWNQKSNISWNDLNYSLIMYITKNDETLDYFHRFTKIKVGNDMWEVKAVDSYSADGIIEIALGEWYNNEFAETQVEESNDSDKDADDQALPHIEGAAAVKPFDTVTYTIVGLQDEDGGNWFISNNKKARFVDRKDNSVTIEIVTGKSGEFDLTYKSKDQSITLPIVIESL
jgi:hypothetical protein